jgi:4-amino-4-deoxy-L-arabinose transferase-like glycosyltransferase
MATSSLQPTQPESLAERLRNHGRARSLSALWARPEVLAVIVIAAVLNLWDLSRNAYANTFYSAAVHSMASSWHDFLFASLDKTGLMTVDKPPAALWVQALSVRIFGFHSLSILVPEALMGVAAAVFAYDLTRRVFGRAAGFAAALTLVLTPITVAMSRHNNPDELLILCCVAAMWCAVRALQDGRTKWLLWCGALIGLGFEAKLSVALFVVPGIFLGYLWVAPAGRGHLHALRQLLWAGLVLAIVALAWPILVTLTPAADRPYISGTSDNSVWSLIVGYNGVGRITGQSGGTGAGGGGFGGGTTGVFRLLDSSLGGQAGWLLGFALVAGVGILIATRLRRDDPRTGWAIAVGGAALVSAVVFSVASGIFHPYYVSFLAPWSALLVGAGVGEALSGSRAGRIIGVLAIAGGAVSELVVLGNIDGSVSWALPLVIVVCIIAVVALGLGVSGRARAVVVAVALAALLAAPATWAADTLGHATSSTFPAGGPASASSGGGFGGFGGAGGRGRAFAGGGTRGGFRGLGTRGGSGGFGGGRGSAGGGFSPPGAFGASGAAGGAGGAGGAIFGGNSTSLTAASKYAASHGGGTVVIESQSSAAAAILAGETNVAGIGGFSGRETTVSTKWLAMEVRDGKIRYLLNTTSGFGGGGAARRGAGTGSSTGAPSFGGRSGTGGFGAGDTRDGSAKAITAAEKVARKITVTENGTKVTLYDLQGKAAAILAQAKG